MEVILSSLITRDMYGGAQSFLLDRLIQTVDVRAVFVQVVTCGRGEPVHQHRTALKERCDRPDSAAAEVRLCELYDLYIYPALQTASRDLNAVNW